MHLVDRPRATCVAQVAPVLASSLASAGPRLLATMTAQVETLPAGPRLSAVASKRLQSERSSRAKRRTLSSCATTPGASIRAVHTPPDAKAEAVSQPDRRPRQRAGAASERLTRNARSGPWDELVV
jgi:hypothetical protein